MNRRAFLLSTLGAAVAKPAVEGIRLANGAFVATGGSGEPFMGYPPFARFGFFGITPIGTPYFYGNRRAKISDDAR